MSYILVLFHSCIYARDRWLVGGGKNSQREKGTPSFPLYLLVNTWGNCMENDDLERDDPENNDNKKMTTLKMKLNRRSHIKLQFN